MDLINRIIHAITEVHPIHPMMVHFPIALTGAGLFFILLALWKNKAFFEQAAFANIALATVSTLAAGITGLYDNQVNYVGDAPNAGLKIILAITLFLVTTATAIARWKKPDLLEKSKPLYVAAYFVSFGLAITLAFLGGIILYGF
ncbi:MAG: hypothetical protein JW963_03465 [Anaerolineales bacterium]|nr:hypothetical protein [Anaerolineales bacterium]